MKQVDVCIIGGGPAGMLAALLLAERKRSVLVVEHHHDFAREYRGEVLMPRFSQMMQQIGLMDWIDTIPHVKIEGAHFYFRHLELGTIQFKNISPGIPDAMWMPQTQLLDALNARATQSPSYEIWFDTKPLAIGDDGGFKKIKLKKGEEEIEVTAKVVIGADGRYSQVRKLLPFPTGYDDYRFDVLWFTIPRPEYYENSFRVFFNGKWNCLVLPKYPNHLQCGLLVAPHELNQIKKQGIEVLKKALPDIHPILKEFAENLKSFTEFHVLKAQMHYVDKWAKDGVVLIGDSAHCCSPAGAIGVSVAAGTAIIAADVIHANLDKYSGALPESVLSEIQSRREKDVLEIHRMQRLVGGALPLDSKFLRYLIPFVLSILVKSPIFKRVQKRLMVMPEPLEVSSL